MTGRRHVFVYVISLFSAGMVLMYSCYHYNKQIRSLNVNPLFRFTDENNKRKAMVSFTKVKDEDIWHFRAVAGYSRDSETYDLITVGGLWHERYTKADVSCCIRYGDNNISKETVENRDKHEDPATLVSRLYVCHIDRDELPIGVTVVPSTMCPTESDQYMAPYFPIRQPGETLAMCTMITYGEANAELIQEWLEVHSSLGVDKVIVFTDSDLNSKARSVIDFYVSKGLIEKLPYFRPGADFQSRLLDYLTTHFNHSGINGELTTGSLANKDSSIYNIAEAINLQCQQLLRGYTYVAVIDWDEFIIPEKFYSLKFVFRQMFKTHPMAAVIRLKSYYYISDWGVSNPSGQFNVTRYIYRSKEEPTKYSKNVYMPDRLSPGDLSLHVSFLKWGEQWIELPPAVAILRHYRRCRIAWLVPSRSGLTKCHDGIDRVIDTTVVKYMERIQDRLVDSRRKIGIKFNK